MPRLDESFDDIKYKLTINDLTKEEEEDEDNGLSGGAIFGIVLGVLVGVAVLIFGLFILYKCFRKKYLYNDKGLTYIKGSLIN